MRSLLLSLVAMTTAMGAGGCRVSELEFTWELRKNGTRVSAAEAGCDRVKVEVRNWSLGGGDEVPEYYPCSRGKATTLTWEGSITVTVTPLGVDGWQIANPYRMDVDTVGESRELGHLVFNVYTPGYNRGTIDVNVAYQRRNTGETACDTPAGVSGSVDSVAYLLDPTGGQVGRQQNRGNCRDYYYFDDIPYGTFRFVVDGYDTFGAACWHGEMDIVHNSVYTSRDMTAAESSSCSYK